ncbi:MAG: hypothetical protein KY429_11040 [Actinobacteria bacterium]|nr:hypothetical protein [Actinomycetota bacterium]
MGRRLARVLILLFFSCVLVIPASYPSQAQAKEVIVNLRGFAFIPEGQLIQGNVTIQAGDTVTWVYAERLQDGGCETFSGCPGHSTTSTGNWDSGVFGKPASPQQYEGNRFSVKFNTAGTYSYFCIPHQGLPAPMNGFQGMKAQVIVEGTAAPEGGGGGGGGGAAPTETVSRPLASTGIHLDALRSVAVLLLAVSSLLFVGLRVRATP